MSDTVSFVAPDDLVDRVDEKLSYGDSRSAYIRKSVTFRLEFEDNIKDVCLPSNDREALEFVIEAVREKAEREGLKNEKA